MEEPVIVTTQNPPGDPVPSPHNPPEGGTPTPPVPTTRRWYIDELVVAAFSFLGFGGAVFLPLRYGFASVPPIVVSFLLATGLAALTYRYLGGIQGASFAVGTLKLSGALAALVGIALLINHDLFTQVQPPPAAQVWELDGQVADDRGAPLQQLLPTDFKLTPLNPRVYPGGNFKLEFYTGPAWVGNGVEFPTLTIERDGLTTDIPLEPDQLKKLGGSTFKLDNRHMYVGSIPLKKTSLPNNYNASAPAPQPASGSQVSAYAAGAAQPPVNEVKP